jgi:hypothetical protein
MAVSAERVTVLLAPRVNGNGFLAVVYRNGKIVPLAVPELNDAVAMITAVIQEQFKLGKAGAESLANLAVDRYAAGVVATEEAHSIVKTLQDQLEEARRMVFALSEELEQARQTSTTG